MATENAPLFPVSGNNEANTHRFVLALGPSWRERFIKRRASRLLQHCILYNAPSPETIKSVSRAEVLRTDTGTEEERGREREREREREISPSRRIAATTTSERGNFAGGNGFGRLAVATFFLPTVTLASVASLARPSLVCSLLIALRYDDSTLPNTAVLLVCSTLDRRNYEPTD